MEFKIEILGDREHESINFVRPFDLSQPHCCGWDWLKRRRKTLSCWWTCIISYPMVFLSQVLREDFMAFYDGKELPPLRLQYKDFAQWQNSQKEMERINRQMAYWLKEFAGEIPVLEITYRLSPADKPEF